MDRLPNCADCDVDTFDNGEMYMVRDELWAAAWAGRRVNCNCGAFGTDGGQGVFEFKDTSRCRKCEVLCVPCLEKRIGRTLTHADFTDCPLNIPNGFTSTRLRSRLERGDAT